MALKHTPEVSAIAVTGTNRVVRVGVVGLPAERHPPLAFAWVIS